MSYLLSFLEGIITFISPCLLPMLPIYLSYFAGQSDSKGKAVIGSLGFVTGFTIVFVSLGAFASSLGKFIFQYSTAVNIITGGIVVLFGLSYLGVIHIKFLNINKTFKSEKSNFFTSVLFGIIFSIGWTPCVGAFLGSALALASTTGSVIEGVLMLLCFSLGLGIPFIISTIFIDSLKSTFDFIKRHYKVITTISGLFLIVTGVMMMTGYMGYLLRLLSF